MLEDRCGRVSLSIYGRSYDRLIVDQVARVYALPDRPLRGVASEALEGGRGKAAFSSTCHEATADQVIRWYAMRCRVEVTFRDSKQCLGFEEPRSRKAVERTVALAMLVHTLVVLWFAKEGHPRWQPPSLRWYPSKADPFVERHAPGAATGTCAAARLSDDADRQGFQSWHDSWNKQVRWPLEKNAIGAS